ncbi:MAG: RnfABCDGE type electron transport complex subunit B, partial [Candidatus Caldatribacterium sp.]|nr:RnfABCDGE type electron transport complex subunit B [Candidatus Caldatribacterium sp.]
MSILIPTILVGALGLAFGFMLAFFAKKFAVPANPLVQEIEQVLPGANCGACGFPGCSALAEKIASGEAPVNACPVGGPRIWLELARLLGQEIGPWEAKRALLLCQGGKGTAQIVATYEGVFDCRAANLLPASFKGCRFGCLSLGNCVRVCPFDAIHMDVEKELPVIDWEKCTGCGKCVAECPRKILTLVPK